VAALRCAVGVCGCTALCYLVL